ncbi:hypothetical protein [Streptomyces sp. ST1015]|uniref:hypothetical protein n=1 Tax=Streptomyces sp. ST1015 TaxID=1848900 RepID=UPI00292CB994|nr:hypothetical protein [Streptomyces sp. ST1015]
MSTSEVTPAPMSTALARRPARSTILALRCLPLWAGVTEAAWPPPRPALDSRYRRPPHPSTVSASRTSNASSKKLSCSAACRQYRHSARWSRTSGSRDPPRRSGTSRSRL